MLRLFRHKMVSVVKYFRRNQFQKKLFSRKYFSAFGLHEKITKSENATVDGIRRTCLAGSGQNCRIPAGHLLARSDPVILAGSRKDQWPDPVRSRRIPAIWARSGRISSRIRSDPAGFRPYGRIRRGQWPDPVRSGRISGRIRSDQAGFRQVSVHGRIPAVFRQPDSGGWRYFGGRIPAAGRIPVVRFRRRHYSSDLMMPDSGAAYFRTTDYCRIWTVRYQTCV
jgi:hypothetical protein